MKKRELSFKIGFAVGLPLALLIVFSFVSFYQFHYLTQFTEKMYKHPYTVSNSVKDIHIGVLQIHREIDRVLKMEAGASVDEAQKKTQALDESVHESFQLLSERFLGDPKDIDDAKSQFEKWQPVRKQIFALIKDGKYEEAQKAAADSQKAVLAELDSSLMKLTDFASQKGLQFYSSARKESRWIMQITGLFLVLGALVTLIISVVTIRSISRPVKDVSFQLNENSQRLQSASSLIKDASDSFAAASTEQSASLSSNKNELEKMTVLMHQSHESIQTVSGFANQSRELADRGQRQLQTMDSQINEIQTAGTQLVDFIHQHNAELDQIYQLIGEIGDKSKLINEIVFQTKILSFNASVEAARAGEFGKGFSVVAEEIGNLAAMSGKSADEIHEILEKGLDQIRSIVDASKTQVSQLVEQNEKAIQDGKSTSQECVEHLQNIQQKAQDVDSLIGEISKASSEQELAIKELFDSMKELTDVAETQSRVANDNKLHGERVFQEVSLINKSLCMLNVLVYGSSECEKNPTQVAVMPTEKSKTDSESQGSRAA